jgi:hypothetical protein
MDEWTNEPTESTDRYHKCRTGDGKSSCLRRRTPRWFRRKWLTVSENLVHSSTRFQTLVVDVHSSIWIPLVLSSSLEDPCSSPSSSPSTYASSFLNSFFGLTRICFVSSTTSVQITISAIPLKSKMATSSKRHARSRSPAPDSSSGSESEAEMQVDTRSKRTSSKTTKSKSPAPKSKTKKFVVHAKKSMSLEEIFQSFLRKVRAAA